MMSSWLVVIGQTVAIGGRAVAHRVDGGAVDSLTTSRAGASSTSSSAPCSTRSNTARVAARPHATASWATVVSARVHVRGDGDVVEPDDRQVVGHAAAATGRRGHPGDGHQIVGEDDRGRLLTRR